MSPPQKPKLAGFDVLEFLGAGAFGEVWRVFDKGLQKDRAVKVVSRAKFSERQVQRLLNEARKTAQLPRHRNRVEVHFVKDGITNCFLVMDYVAGRSLDRLISPGHPLPWGPALRYVAGVADGLRDVHERGLIHRDIKPGNILWDPDADEAL